MEKLPPELLCLILKHLSFTDKLQCCLVCKSWRLVIHSNPSLMEDVGAFVLGSTADLNDLLTRLSSSNIVNCITSLVIKECDVFYKFPGQNHWNEILPKLRTLSLHNVEIHQRDFYEILSRCVRLRSLSLIGLRDLFRVETLFSVPSEVEKLKSALSNVRYLNLSNNQSLSDMIFQRIVCCLPNLEILILDYCRLANHVGIYRKFYPVHEQEFMSHSVFTFKCVLKYLAHHGRNIKELGFARTDIDGLALQDLGALPQINIHRINLFNCSSVSQDGLLGFLRNQLRLRSLNLGYCRRVLVDYPATCQLIFEHLQELEELCLTGLSIKSGFEIMIQELPKLRKLDLSGVDVPSRRICDGLKRSKFVLKLRELRLVGFFTEPEILLETISPFKNLTDLDLSACQGALTDQVLIYICSEMPKVTRLYLKNCPRITDDGILRLGLLRNLSRLELTHASLVSPDVFALPELRYLNFSYCNSIRSQALASWASLNPQLETVILKQCHSLIDSCLIGMVTSWPRLLALDVEGCLSLTYEGLKRIPLLCPNIKYLDVSLCLKIKPSEVSQLSTQCNYLKDIHQRGLQYGELLDEKEDHSHPVPPPMPN